MLRKEATYSFNQTGFTATKVFTTFHYHHAPCTILAWGDAGWKEQAKALSVSIYIPCTHKRTIHNQTQVEILGIASPDQCHRESTNQWFQQGETFQWHPKCRSTLREMLTGSQKRIILWFGVMCLAVAWCRLMRLRWQKRKSKETLS